MSPLAWTIAGLLILAVVVVWVVLRVRSANDTINRGGKR